jgi:hypothetical protein
MLSALNLQKEQGDKLVVAIKFWMKALEDQKVKIVRFYL